jgi:hypothetical protein
MSNMQHCKGIKNISEVGKYASDSSVLLKTFENIIGQFRLTYVNELLNKAKVKGIQGDKIFKTLFVFCFLGIKNVNQLMLSGYSKELNHGKDVFYDYLKNEWVDGSKILTLFIKQFIKIVDKKEILQILKALNALF